MWDIVPHSGTTDWLRIAENEYDDSDDFAYEIVSSSEFPQFYSLKPESYHPSTGIDCDRQISGARTGGVWGLVVSSRRNAATGGNK
jgi:hypothetical protein